MTRVAVIADAGREMGAGHASRCFAAVAAAGLGELRVCWFAHLAEIPWLLSQVEEAGHDVVSSARSADLLENHVLAWRPDVVLVDSYLLPPGFGTSILAEGVPLVALVDPSTPHRPATLTWMPGFSDCDIAPEGIRGVSGPEAVLFHPRILALGKNRKGAPSSPTPGDPWRIGVMAGGGRGAELARSVVADLSQSLSRMDIHTNVPVQPPPAAQSGVLLRTHRAGLELWDILADCHLVVTPAGLTAWELMYLQIPAGLILAYPNQAENYHGMIRRGWAWGLGTMADLDEGHRPIREVVEVAMSDWGEARARSLRARAAVDGLGCQRLAQTLVDLKHPHPAKRATATDPGYPYAGPSRSSEEGAE